MANFKIPFSQKNDKVVEEKNNTESSTSNFKTYPKEVVVPENVTYLGYEYSRTNIEKVFIHASVDSIQGYAFAGCNSLKKIEVDPANPNFWVKDDFVIAKNYKTCTKEVSNAAVAFVKHTKDLVIPEGVEYIGKGLFSYSDITSVTIANSVIDTEGEIFLNCHNLETIIIGDGLKDINSWCFKGCDNLKEIKVSPNNPYLVVEDGMLMSKDKTTLYFAFPKDELVLPSTLNFITPSAFYLCKNIKIIFPEKYELGMMDVIGCENCTLVVSDACKELEPYRDVKDLTIEMYHTGKPKSAKRKYQFKSVKKVVLPDYLKNISKWAFNYCTELEEVVIPETVETVEKHAFTNCTSLRNLRLPQLVQTLEAEALIGVPHVELPNLCVVTDGYFDLDAPLAFENSKGRLYSSKSTSELALYGVDTDESRQRYEVLNHV